MFNVGGAELLVILLVALLVLGPNKLPEAARQFGNLTRELRRLSSGFQAEMRAAVDEATADPSTPAQTPTDRPQPLPRAETPTDRPQQDGPRDDASPPD